jgi:SAM-dependent methyltransferase
MSEAVFTGERLPGGGDAEFAVDMERHIAAYRWAAERAAGRRVLDAGCGEGYGAALLARSAAQVVAVDRAEPIATARARHQAPNLEYRVADLERLAALGDRFDLVVSFQVIEHMPDPVGFLRGLLACTAPGGQLIVTTPNRLMTLVENPYHLREWTASELLELARPVLPQAEMLGMHASERVLAYERARGAQIQRIMRLDPLGLRKLLPEPVVKGAFAFFAKLVRRRVQGEGALPSVGPDDFHVAGGDLSRVLDLVLVAPGPPA